MPPKKDKAKPRGPTPNQVARQEDLLRQGMQQIGLLIEEHSVSLLITYINLLLQQNQTINLTAITDPLEAVTKHLLDSLSIAQYIPDGKVVDVGSGGGCPGIPLAIIKPESQIILVESKNKKADFLNTTTQALKLKNTKTICQRAESVELTKKVDTAVCRALGSISYFISVAGHMLKKQGRLLAMKGKIPHSELSEIPLGWEALETKKIHVPHLQAERHLITVCKST
jgi:16S rRNA (guanine527-N7)-methyltransferase